MSLSAKDLDRHKRHIMLKEIGGPGVQKLANASVSIVGAGALGGPCAMYLAAAGVGTIELWDDDRVDRSNLQRQVQFGDADVGRLKVDALKDRLSHMNADLTVSSRPIRFDADQLISSDIIVDATDNYETRFVLNELAHVSRRPLVHGAAARWTGQVSVFASGFNTEAPCYRCWVPEKPPEAEACEDVGVAGPVTGLVGTHMALETIKLITGAGETLIGQMMVIDGLTGNTRRIGLRRDPECPTCLRRPARQA